MFHDDDDDLLPRKPSLTDDQKAEAVWDAMTDDAVVISRRKLFGGRLELRGQTHKRLASLLSAVYGYGGLTPETWIPVKILLRRCSLCDGDMPLIRYRCKRPPVGPGFIAQLAGRYEACPSCGNLDSK